MWSDVLEGTRVAMKAKKRWDPWPSSADPAARLAFLHQLRAMDMPVWWLNLYFVGPHGSLSKLPATRQAWDTELQAARQELSITPDHVFTEYVEHLVMPVPGEGLKLAELA